MKHIRLDKPEMTYAPPQQRIPPMQAFEPNYILENTGQTMHFFSKAYLLELLADWPEVTLEAVTIRDQETGEPFKQVWRGIGRR
jgi:hypothetical protein